MSHGEVLIRFMQWWDIEKVVALETELFTSTAWSAETWWAELAQPQSRHYLIAEPAPAEPATPDIVETADVAEPATLVDAETPVQPAESGLHKAFEPATAPAAPAPLGLPPAHPDLPLAGYAGLSVGMDQCDIQTMAVAPAWQHQGIGRRLLAALLAQVPTSHPVLLEVRADNDPAKNLYRSAGFEQIAVRRRYYQPEDVDALILRRPAVAAGDRPH